MSQFHSLRSFSSEKADGSRAQMGEKAVLTEEAVEQRSMLQHMPVTSALQDVQWRDIYNNTDALSPYPTPLDYIPGQTSSLHKAVSLRTTTPPGSMINTVQHPTTATNPLSLVTALELTLTPRSSRAPLVIPADKKRAPRVRDTEGLRLSQRRTSSRLRLGVVLGVLAGFFLFSLFSLHTLADGSTGIAPVDNAIHWVQMQQQNLNIAAMRNPVEKNNPAVADAPANSGQPVAPVPTGDYISIARQAATANGIPPDLYVRQINAESGFNPNAASPAGAVGIAQFLPSTAAGLGFNPYDPVASLYGGARYMADLYRYFNGDYAKALAGYNAGAGAVDAAVRQGGTNWLAFTPYETQNYVRKIMG